MPEFVKLRLPATNLDRASETELTTLLNALIDAIRIVTAKLDGDATVTLTDYTAAFDAVVAK